MAVIDFNIKADIERKRGAVVTYDFSVSADVQRSFCMDFEANADIRRSFIIDFNIEADIDRKLTGELDSYTALNISLQSKTISDTFDATIADSPKNIGDRFFIKAGDFNYPMKVKSISGSMAFNRQQNRFVGTEKLTGAFEQDELLEKLISITPSDSASACLSQVCSQIGKSPVILFDNFNIVKNSDTTSQTYRDIISRLFGWSSNIQNQQINVFIRGNKIYAIQRGKESKITDISIDDIAFDSKIQYTKMRLSKLLSDTDTAGAKFSGSVNGANVNNYLTGDYVVGDSKISYLNGLVVKESSPNNDGTITETTYEYNKTYPPAIENSRTVLVKAGSVISKRVVYQNFYESFNGEYQICKQTETEYNYGSSSATTTKITEYSPLGQGEYAVKVTINGKFSSQKRQRGLPSGTASPYSSDKYSRSNSGNSSPLSGASIEGIEFPITDTGTLNRISQQIMWLHKKTEEKITISIPTASNGHIFDFTEQIRFNNNIYYLESNQISVTPSKISQNLTLIRWY